MAKENGSETKPPSNLPSAPAETNHTREAAGRCRVLVIEDSVVDYKVVEGHLKRAKGVDFQITRAERLGDGLEHLSRESVDIVLLDLMLPDSQGLETVRSVRAEASGVPIVVLTSAEDERIAFSAIRQGAQDYLIKREVDSDLLVRSARHAIERQRLLRELEQLAHVAAHDLQEPLRTISGFCELLQDTYGGKLDDQADEWLEFAIQGARRMSGIIQDLLGYSRIGLGDDLVEPTDCTVVFDEAVENLRAAIEENGAVVTHDDLPILMGVRTRLVHLFQNLISNAIKYRGDQRPCVHAAAERMGREWLFSVRDNGIGIAAEHLGRIFAIFKRLHSRDQYSGTGIGLAICKKIVEIHGGRIWAESEPGSGSVFYFTIPE